MFSSTQSLMSNIVTQLKYLLAAAIPICSKQLLEDEFYSIFSLNPLILI